MGNMFSYENSIPNDFNGIENVFYSDRSANTLHDFKLTNLDIKWNPVLKEFIEQFLFDCSNLLGINKYDIILNYYIPLVNNININYINSDINLSQNLKQATIIYEQRKSYYNNNYNLIGKPNDKLEILCILFEIYEYEIPFKNRLIKTK